MEDLLTEYSNEEIVERADEIRDDLGNYFISNDADYGVCAGSWKAYNECSKNALGCHYETNYFIDPQKIEDELEFYAVLYASGFSFDEMEELFVQDVNGSSFGLSCDNTHPYNLIKALNENNVFDGNNMMKLEAITELEGGSFWNNVENLDNYELYHESKEEYEENFCEECCYDEMKAINNSWIGSYIEIDYSRMADEDYQVVGEYEVGYDTYTLIKR